MSQQQLNTLAAIQVDLMHRMTVSTFSKVFSETEIRNQFDLYSELLKTVYDSNSVNAVINEFKQVSLDYKKVLNK